MSIDFCIAVLYLSLQTKVDLVTETDKACEDLIFSYLKEKFPSHKVSSNDI